MRAPGHAGLVAGAIAVTAGGGASIASDGWPQAALRRATAAIGRCDVCGLAAACWHEPAGRLCTACYEREVRHGVGRGERVPAGWARGTGAAPRGRRCVPGPPGRNVSILLCPYNTSR
jgi:hypothetical protein